MRDRFIRYIIENNKLRYRIPWNNFKDLLKIVFIIRIPWNNFRLVKNCIYYYKIKNIKHDDIEK